MQSNYKRLGDYIREAGIRNRELFNLPLLGVSIQKKLIPSIANIVGTDMSSYKLIVKHQFAYGPVTSRNGDKISIAILEDDEKALLSQMYTIFEVMDKNELIPEYLMMWFKRPEFDRYARFMSHGSAREIFSWAEMCDTLLPIPSLEKQLEIVREYKVIQNRIKLNDLLIAKLEETAQAVYKQWFVDFEFPDENGLPYKSSAGEMVESDLGKIPKGWEVGDIGKISNQFSGYSFKGEDYSLQDGFDVLRGENVTERNLRWDTHKKWKHDLNPRMKKCFLQENDIVIGMDGSKVGKNWALINKYDLPLLLAQRVTCLRGKSRHETSYIYMSMMVHSFYDYVNQVQTGTSVPHISGDQIKKFPLLIPANNIIRDFGTGISAILDKINLSKQNLIKLKEMKIILLSKLVKVEIEKEFA